MIPGMRLPPLDRPGFCQRCYCEHCSKGFFEKARYAVKFSDGRVNCNDDSCNGEVRALPLMAWQRMTPCRKCGRGPLQISADSPQLLLAS